MMFIIIFLRFIRSEDEGDEDLIQSLKEFAKMNDKVQIHQNEQAKYKILKISKKHIPVGGNVEVVMDVNPPPSSGFCKFDIDNIVEARITNGKVYCKVPAHSPGRITLSFSDDKEDWSEAVPIVYFSNENTVVIIVGVFIGVSIISFVLFLFQMRKCQNESKRNREKIPIAIQESNSSLSIEDSLLTKPVQRNVSHLL